MISLDHWIKKRYGSKKGLSRLLRHSFLAKLGAYNRLKKVDFKTTKRLIFVCQGNICRSPLAEAVAKSLGVPTISYGLNCTPGHPADKRTLAFAQKNGLDLNNHRTRCIDEYEPQAGDLLIGMEPAHSQRLFELFGNKIPITLAGLWGKKKMPYIHDPFNANPIFFNHSEALVATAVTAITQKMLSTHEK